MQQTIDTETGEVWLTPEDQAHLCVEATDSLDYITKVGDIIAGKLERAKRYREQAEKRAKPLEKSAAWMLEQIRQVVIALAKEKLPKIQSGDKAGEYRSKTLNLETCSFSFTKDGGIYVADEGAAIKFIEEQTIFPELDGCLNHAPQLNKEKFLKTLKSLQLIGSPHFDQKALLSFLTITEVDEFAKIKVNV